MSLETKIIEIISELGPKSARELSTSLKVSLRLTNCTLRRMKEDGRLVLTGFVKLKMPATKRHRHERSPVFGINGLHKAGKKDVQDEWTLTQANRLQQQAAVKLNLPPKQKVEAPAFPAGQEPEWWLAHMRISNAAKAAGRHQTYIRG